MNRFSDFDKRYLLPRVLLSLATSALILGLLLRYVTHVSGPGQLPDLFSILTHLSMAPVAAYVVFNLAGALIRTMRYSLLLDGAGEGRVSFSSLFLATVARNMFVDMLPARMGELSFVALLNRSDGVRVDSGISALAVSFVFDLLALAWLTVMLGLYLILTATMPGWLFWSVALLLILGIGSLLVLFVLFPWLARLLFTSCTGHGVAQRAMRKLARFATLLDQIRGAGITLPVAFQSVLVRLMKYGGLYCLYLAVLNAGFPTVTRDVAIVMTALIGAEAAAAMPVPAFMGFGVYEMGGAAALALLGVDRGAAVLLMLALHIISQVVDYSLGLLAMIGFIHTAPPLAGKRSEKGTLGRFPHFRKLFLVGILCFSLGFLGWQVHGWMKMGHLTRPATGHRVDNRGEKRTPENIVAGLHGFVVWSSNRFGNHDILKLSLPDRKLTRLTHHPHTEYFPRISPDGRKIVFARSRAPWVPQRNYYAWDVYFLDLETGREQLVAEHGNVPTWSKDGKAVFFQRNGNLFVRHELDNGRELVIASPGSIPGLPQKIIFETPSWSLQNQAMAVTLRGGMRETAIIDARGNIRRVGDGCQLTWSPDGSFLYQVDHGGNVLNAIYRVNAKTLTRTLWFDASGRWSHEYFPKLSNCGKVLVFGASQCGHEHDSADYEIFLWPVNRPVSEVVRLTYHTGNDCWPDIFLRPAS